MIKNLKHIKHVVQKTTHLSRRHWPLMLAVVFAGLVWGSVFYQIIYPTDRLLPFTLVDGVRLGGWNKSDAATRLDELYLKDKLSIYFGSSKTATATTDLQNIGISVSNSARLAAYDYPWYLRIVPSSIFWADYVIGGWVQPEYSRDQEILGNYVLSNLSGQCDKAPQNASLSIVKNKLVITPSIKGTKCNIASVKAAMSAATPHLGSRMKVTISVVESDAAINDNVANKFGDQLLHQIGDGVTISVNGKITKISASEVIGWIDLLATNDAISYSLNTSRASIYLDKNIAPVIATEPGTTVITTKDFEEISRTVGAIGKKLNYAETLASIKRSVDDGVVASAVVETAQPQIEYVRTYSATDSGLSALLQQYAQAHSGITSVSFVELEGDKRRASFAGNSINVAGSTYKLFVAYSTLLRVEDGRWNWDDQIIDGRNLTTCFDDMITWSDNDCAEALMGKIGYSVATNEARGIGCTRTSFVDNSGYAVTSSDDLALLLSMSQTGQILSQQSSRDILINALKRNVYRSGIPAGVSSEVANKVGFIDGYLNDAAIVYSPSGTYVLSIMTNGTDWSAIADLAAQVELLRAE